VDGVYEIAPNSALAPIAAAYIRSPKVLTLDALMIIILYILTGLAFACVVLTLVMGTVAMSNKSEESRIKSNKWMWRRVYAQVAAIVLLGITFYARSKGA